MTMERPQTARTTTRRGAASPYHALPGDAGALGLQMRPKTAHVAAPSAPAAEGPGPRSVYVRAPRPPGAAMREYAPLRPRAQSGQAQGHGQAWQGDSEGGETGQPLFDAVRQPGRPTSARIAVGQAGALRKPPPLSARGRMQSDGAPDPRGEALSRRASAGAPDRESIYEDYESIYEDDGGGNDDVVIFPAPSKAAFIPPQPLIQDPSPRRRPLSAFVRGSAAMPAAEQDLPTALPQVGGAGSAAQSRGAMLRDLAPVMTAIASLTHETNLGKLVQRIDAVVLVLLEADASRLVVYNQNHCVLQVVRPGETDATFLQAHANQHEVDGITGMCAQAGTLVNRPDLRDGKDVNLEVDLGLSVIPDRQHVSCLAAPARDRDGNVVAVISAVRMGNEVNPFNEEAVQIMELIAQQAGAAVALCLQRLEMQRAAVNNKILMRAAVDLTKAADLDAGSLTLLASTYAKKLADCDSVIVGLSHDRQRMLRTWSILDADAPGHRDKSILAGDVRMEERSHIPCPPALKKVVTTGSVANLLLHGPATHSEHGELVRLNEPGLHASCVIQGATVEYDRHCDSCVAVPLQTEPGGRILGLMLATNRFGGPRKAGKNGIFTNLEEGSLRELASIVTATLIKILRVSDLESTVAIAPAITKHHTAESAMTETCKTAGAPLKADRVFIFAVQEDGSFQLHNTGHDDHGHHHPGGGKEPVVRRSQSHRPGLHKPAVRLPANSYPLVAAVQSRTAMRVRMHDVSDVIIGKKNGLLPFATDMLVCAIRDSTRQLYGVMVVVSLKHEPFPEYCMPLLKSVSEQLGAVLQRCAHTREQAEHVRALKFASTELLDVVNQREVKTVIEHVVRRIPDFVCCGRAVLYIVDRQQHVVWTVVQTESGEECIVTYDIKSHVNPDDLGSRVGYVNAALYQGHAVIIKNEASAQPAYNDILDSVDIKHVEKLHKMQSGAYDAATKAAMREEGLEPQQRTESIAAVPVRDSEGEVIAVLQVMNRWKSASVRKVRKEGFDQDDIDKLELVVAAVSSTLETSARLNRQWERENELRSIIDSDGHSMQLGMGATCRVNLNDALSYVAKGAYSKCGASQVVVYLLDDEGQMDIIRFEGTRFVPCKRVKAPVEGIAGMTIRTGQKYNIADAHQDPNFVSSVDEKLLLPVASILTCPIKDPNGKIVGALVMQNKKASHKSALNNDPDPFRAHGTHSSRKAIMIQGHDNGWQQFDACDERVIEAAAKGLGVAFTQFILFDNISNVSERLKDISQELELDRTCDAIADACKQLCKASHCVVFLCDHKTGDVLCRMQKFGHFRIPKDYGIPGAVRKRGGTVFFRNQAELNALIIEQRNGLAQTEGFTEHKTERYTTEYEGLWNCMGVPMIDANGRIVGVLEIGNKIGRTEFTPQDERLIRVIPKVRQRQFFCFESVRVYQ